MSDVRRPTRCANCRKQIQAPRFAAVEMRWCFRCCGNEADARRVALQFSKLDVEAFQ